MKQTIALFLGLASAEPLLHPDTGLAITTTGHHWYGQEPLALAQFEPTRIDDAKFKNQYGGAQDYNGNTQPIWHNGGNSLSQFEPTRIDDAKFKNQYGGAQDYNGNTQPIWHNGGNSLAEGPNDRPANAATRIDDAHFKNQFAGHTDYSGNTQPIWHNGGNSLVQD